MKAPQHTPPSGFEPDLEEARTFLSLLDPDAREFTFQTFTDRKGRDTPILARVLSGTLEEHAPELKRRNGQGAGIYITVNKTDGTGRKAENIVSVRAIWQDADDKGEASTFPLKPSIIVESSQGRYHRYWLVKGLTADEHRGVMEHIDVLYGTDSNTKDISRVLRLPGFFHCKGEPHLVRIVEASGEVYTREKVLAVFQPIPTVARTSEPDRTITAPDEPTRDAEALAALEREKQALAETAPGSRNAALNTAACKLGHLVPHRLSYDQDVKPALIHACEVNGLAAEGMASVLATLRSGIKKGMQDPLHERPTSDPDKDFADFVDMPAGEQPNVLEFPSDISLEKIRLRQSSALVKGLLHPKETAMLYGASGSGKSFIGLDLGFHVANGREWHRMRVKQSAVLYVCLEGVDGFRKRMLTYHGELGDPGKNFARQVGHVSLVKSEAGKKGADRVIEAAHILSEEAGMPTRLIIIDTLARAMAGDDENATAEMTNFVEKRAGYIARATGAAVLIVHHTNAAGTARGNGSLWAGCDTVLRADRDNDRRTLIAEKVKDGTEGPLFNYSLEQVELGEDDEGTPITSCVVRTTPVAPRSTRLQKLTLLQRSFIEAHDRAIAAGHFITTPSGIPDGPPLVQADERAVQDEFIKGYSNTGASAETKARQWRRARNEVATQFEFGVSGGIDRVWRDPIFDPGSAVDSQ